MDLGNILFYPPLMLPKKFSGVGDREYDTFLIPLSSILAMIIRRSQFVFLPTYSQSQQY